MDDRPEAETCVHVSLVVLLILQKPYACYVLCNLGAIAVSTIIRHRLRDVVATTKCKGPFTRSVELHKLICGIFVLSFYTIKLTKMCGFNFFFQCRPQVQLFTL